MKRILATCLALLSAPSLVTAPALADNISIVYPAPTVLAFGTVDATASYTNSTTSATDIAAATITVPATRKALVGTTASPTGKSQYIKACYTADAGKATATTGTITLLIGGVSYAAAARTIGVTRASLTACAIVARSAATATIVKLQGVSGDTNAFTVYNAALTVEVLYYA